MNQDLEKIIEEAKEVFYSVNDNTSWFPYGGDSHDFDEENALNWIRNALKEAFELGAASRGVPESMIGVDQKTVMEGISKALKVQNLCDDYHKLGYQQGLRKALELIPYSFTIDPRWERFYEWKRAIEQELIDYEKTESKNPFYPMNKNAAGLASFTNYCNKHPDERFMQALRNWLNVATITVSKKNLLAGDKATIEDFEDTFFWEDKKLPLNNL